DAWLGISTATKAAIVDGHETHLGDLPDGAGGDSALAGLLATDRGFADQTVGEWSGGWSHNNSNDNDNDNDDDDAIRVGWT
ncbi:hypothetical protein LTR16_007767, partial [Cryomyces antarcticus]